MLGWDHTLPSPLAPTPGPQCWDRGGFPPPALPSHPCCISLYRTIFKMEAKTQYTLDRHTHMHTGVCSKKGQDVSCTRRAPRNAYGAPPGEEGRVGALPWPSQSPSPLHQLPC